MRCNRHAVLARVEVCLDFKTIPVQHRSRCFVVTHERRIRSVNEREIVGDIAARAAGALQSDSAARDRIAGNLRRERRVQRLRSERHRAPLERIRVKSVVIRILSRHERINAHLHLAARHLLADEVGETGVAPGRSEAKFVAAGTFVAVGAGPDMSACAVGKRADTPPAIYTYGLERRCRRVHRSRNCRKEVVAVFMRRVLALDISREHINDGTGRFCPCGISTRRADGWHVHTLVCARFEIVFVNRLEVAGPRRLPRNADVVRHRLVVRRREKRADQIHALIRGLADVAHKEPDSGGAATLLEERGQVCRGVAANEIFIGGDGLRFDRLGRRVKRRMLDRAVRCHVCVNVEMRPVRKRVFRAGHLALVKVVRHDVPHPRNAVGIVC